jgi:exonuclease VII small subunit
VSKKELISEKIKRLEAAVAWFYSDEFSLDEAEERYKMAAGLAKEIEEDLLTLKNRVEVIAEDFTK